MAFKEEIDPISMADAGAQKGDTPNYIDKLKKQVDKEIIGFDVPMKDHTSFKAGGTAEVLITPRNKMELQEVLEITTEGGANPFIIGNGSNILVKDGGYQGPIIKIGEAFSKIEIKGDSIKVGAGALLSKVANEAAMAALTGMEFTSGIPGTIGGAVFMNAGAYEEEMKDIVKEVRVLSRDGQEEKILFPRDLKLAYRQSSLMETGQIVLSVTLALKPGEKEEIAAKMEKLLEQRNLKQPVNFPSAGSFFKRPKNNFAGKLVQDAKLKGLSVGGAQVSEKHAGFIINTGEGTATEIIELMHQVQTIVKDKFNINLEPEVRIIGNDKPV